VNRLPRSLDALHGMRAARWVRESTEQQVDRFGPDAQREQQDRAIERWGLADTGLAWQVSHSGRTVATTPAFAEMLAAAGDAFDVLMVGYVSRFARDLRTAVNARHDLHAAGAALLFCDERVLSSDESAWELWAREAVEAEAYSRRLGRRVSEGYAAKFRRHGDPGGNAPLGFRRVGGFLEVDPVSVGRAVDVFRRYSSGTVSLPNLEAETGIDHEALKVMLRNPIYNGWVRRHPRGEDAQVTEAPWRSAPPVDDELWARVQEVRADRDTGGGRSTRRYVHLLAGKVYCVCGVRIRSEMRSHDRWPHRRYRHPDRCPAWPSSTRMAYVFEDPISAQVEQMRVGPQLLVNLRRLAELQVATPDSTWLRRRQLERDLDGIARRHARRGITTDAYLAEHSRLTHLIDSAQPAPANAPVVDPDVAIRWLRDVRSMWRAMDDEGRRELAAGIYERITVTSGGIVEVEPTQEALRHGIALALPERVVLARPEGLEPPTL
jgi:DNA invertase Pin-like site-specific DNA recombinase